MKPKPISEMEWERVFRIRCASKEGRGMSEDDRALITRAYEADPKRYASMNDDIFDATVPIGSNAKAPRRST